MSMRISYVPTGIDGQRGRRCSEYVTHGSDKTLTREQKHERNRSIRLLQREFAV